MEGGGGMSVVKHFNEEEAQVVETLLQIYYANRVAVVEQVGGKLRSHRLRDYVDRLKDKAQRINVR